MHVLQLCLLVCLAVAGDCGYKPRSPVPPPYYGGHHRGGYHGGHPPTYPHYSKPRYPSPAREFVRGPPFPPKAYPPRPVQPFHAYPPVQAFGPAPVHNHLPYFPKEEQNYLAHFPKQEPNYLAHYPKEEPNFLAHYPKEEQNYLAHYPKEEQNYLAHYPKDEDKGPIHTIPAPNLSPADRPAGFQDAFLTQQYFNYNTKPHDLQTATEEPGLHKANQVTPAYFAPDPDPSVPTLKVPPTTDPHSQPSNGQVPLDLYLQQQAEENQVDSQLTAQDLFNLLNYQPNLIPQQHLQQHTLQPNVQFYSNPLYLPQSFQYQAFDYDERHSFPSQAFSRGNALDSAVAGTRLDEAVVKQADDKDPSKDTPDSEETKDEIMKQDEDIQHTIAMYESSFPKSSQEQKARKLDLTDSGKTLNLIKSDKLADLDVHIENQVPYGARIRPKRY